MDVWIRRVDEALADKPRKGWSKPDLAQLSADSPQAALLRDHIEHLRKG